MAPKVSTPTLFFDGADDVMLHAGGGCYVHVTRGDPVPDGVDPSTLGPDWVPSTNKPVTANTTTEEV